MMSGPTSHNDNGHEGPWMFCMDCADQDREHIRREKEGTLDD